MGIVIVPKGIVLLVGNNFDSDIAHLGWERVVKQLRHLQEIYKIQYLSGAQRGTGDRLSWLMHLSVNPIISIRWSLCVCYAGNWLYH